MIKLAMALTKELCQIGGCYLIIGQLYIQSEMFGMDLP